MSSLCLSFSCFLPLALGSVRFAPSQTASTSKTLPSHDGHARLCQVHYVVWPASGLDSRSPCPSLVLSRSPPLSLSVSTNKYTSRVTLVCPGPHMHLHLHDRFVYAASLLCRHPLHLVSYLDFRFLLPFDSDIALLYLPHPLPFCVCPSLPCLPCPDGAPRLRRSFHPTLSLHGLIPRKPTFALCRSKITSRHRTCVIAIPYSFILTSLSILTALSTLQAFYEHTQAHTRCSRTRPGANERRVAGRAVGPRTPLRTST
ncbi:hypothetical protein PYCCODRAFT_922875 [Trametes coccinea BRFM310]|uniref:Uncharacterized protein n=1 Tax=Trametes coccinea (strain BRFM310) TaxID=1353009 RepID=A0A1Y2IYZ0_TRAC3|nr:hypothetical protein PYCCODRAFT_922875 [Trametes coccinea BRFM310]